jgi:hypothetical protein
MAEESLPEIATSVGEGPVVVEDHAESWYHLTAYYLVKQQKKAWWYLFTSFIVMSFQLLTLLAFIIAKQLTTYESELTSSANFFNANVPSVFSKVDYKSILTKATQFPSNSFDRLTLVYVAAVLAFNVIKEFQETFITEVYALQLWDDNIGLLKQNPKYWIIALLTYARRYLLSVFVVACSVAVMSGSNAQDILLNGLAIYFILEVDNLLFDVLHSNSWKEKMQDELKVGYKDSFRKYVNTFCGCHAVAIFISVVVSASMDVDNIAYAYAYLAGIVVVTFTVAGSLSLIFQVKDTGCCKCDKSFLARLGEGVGVALFKPAISCGLLLMCVYLTANWKTNEYNTKTTDLNTFLNCLNSGSSATLEGCSAIVSTYSS